MKTRIIFYIGLAFLMAGCVAEEEQTAPQDGVLQLTSSVNAFDGEAVTRTNLTGNAFATGDWMKLKIICPYSDHVEFGETTYSNTFDALWLLKWSGSEWTPITGEDKVDVAGQYKYTSAYSLFGRYEAQQTPYVYTASTWNENVIFISNGTMYSQYTYVYRADQTTEANYLKSDLLWAQTYMQTGSYNKRIRVMKNALNKLIGILIAFVPLLIHASPQT